MPVYDGEHVKYTYNDKNQVSAITTTTTEYTFTYDSYGNTKTIKAGDETLATYNYNPNNGKLQSLVYGNGTTVEYVYDKLDRIEEIWYTEGSTETLKYRYTYTADGNLHTVEDLDSGEGHMYSYDSEGRMSGYIKYSLSDSTIDTSADYTYDQRSRLDSIDVSFVYTAGTTKTYSYLGYGYTYNDDDALTDLSINLANPGEEKVTLKYTYDNLYRLSGKTYSYQSGYTNTVGYVYKDRGTSYTTGQVSQYSTKINNNTATTYTYTYDINGNITQIVDNNGKVTKYYYDDIGQLTREDNPYLNKSYSYTYDKNGNRISKSTYQYTTAATLPSDYQSYEYWQYGNDDWGDQLTGYSGTPITYDEIGNPLTYSNYEFEWENGRRLKKITVGLGMSVYEYTYNDEGIRTSKTVTGTTHYYTLNGSQILTEQFGNIFIVYLYDESGSPIGMQYRTNSMAEGTFYTYLFEKNLQGDIIAVYNTSGTKLISYYYDAWGNFVKTTHNISGTNVGAQYNPFTYRGYYYDTETGLYYVSSRYYDPEISRWINADSQLNTSLGVLGLNQFSYCLNNPVNMVDYGGNKPGDLFDTMDEAARDFAEYINETSIEVDREYASYIYTKTVWETKTVTYYNPNLFGNNLLSRFWNYIFGGGISKTVKKRVKVTKYTYVKPAKGTAHSSTIPINWFGMHNQVALLHTHGAYSPGYGNDVFSSTDKNLANRKNMPIYVATPLGTLRKYNPSNGTDIVLYDDLPFDPNHPGR